VKGSPASFSVSAPLMAGEANVPVAVYVIIGALASDTLPGRARQHVAVATMAITTFFRKFMTLVFPSRKGNRMMTSHLMIDGAWCTRQGIHRILVLTKGLGTTFVTRVTKDDAPSLGAQFEYSQTKSY
jgi:hypothetical protein